MGEIKDSMRLRFILVAAPALASLVVAACEPTGVPLAPRVQFRVTDTVGPCSTSLSIRFTLDGAFLAEEPFGLSLPPNRRLSSEFFVAPGTHTLGAQIAPNGFSWPDTTVTLAPDQLFVRTIDLYCS